jgi:hypothetical protein
MAKSNITVKLFVDWDNRRVMTSGELSEYRDELIGEMKTDGRFEAWLDDNFMASEVWDNADNIEDNWDEHCEEEADTELENLEEVEIDLMPHEYKVGCPF